LTMAKQERELKETLMRLGFTYDRRRGAWVMGDVVVRAGVGVVCMRPWLVVRRGNMAAQIHVAPGAASALVTYRTEADAPTDRRELLEFHDLVHLLLGEVKRIKPEC